MSEIIDFQKKKLGKVWNEETGYPREEGEQLADIVRLIEEIDALDLELWRLRCEREEMDRALGPCFPD